MLQCLCMKTFLGIDYGIKRIGLATGSDATRLASPLRTMVVDDDYLQKLEAVVTEEGINELVVGLPRTLAGDDNAQTQAARLFATELAAFGLPVHLQDEAGTSELARDRIGKKLHDKGQIDAEAATIILQDYLDNL
jgi:putative Holliday junction resolvase